MININFTYDHDKDVWCLLNKGKSSNNSQIATKVYESLVNTYGENPTEGQTSMFINKYIVGKEISIENRIQTFKKDWLSISEEYYKRARSVFNVSLDQDITIYLTVNTRCPYNIENNYFFVSILSDSVSKTIMHELWHFYTWYALGIDEEKKLGKEKYNEIKEALTVLLNVECADLFPKGVQDNGYPQHRELRERIINLWNEEKDIYKLWGKLIS